MPILIIILMILFAGCSKDECSKRESKCEGNAVATCTLVPDTDFSNHFVLRKNDCGEKKCVSALVSGETFVFCALDAEPDPKCSGQWSDRDSVALCDGSTLLKCNYGYASSRNDCGDGLCVETPCEAVAVCRAESVPLDLCPAAPANAYRCLEEQIVTCSCGTANDLHTCAQGTCIMETFNGSENAVCR